MTKNATENQKVAVMDNSFTKEHLHQMKTAQKQVVFRRRRLAVIFGVAAIALLIMGINLFHQTQSLFALQKEQVSVQKQKEAAADKKENLEAEVSLLKDKRYVQKLARQKNLVSIEGEKVYVTP